MLQVEAEFPNPGAKALLIEGAKASPVRIHAIVPDRAKGAKRTVVVTLLDRDTGASGTRRVTVGDLTDANPLNAEEAAELAAIEARYAGKHLSERSPFYKRYMALWQRQQHALQAEELERRKGKPAPEPRWSGRGRA